MEIISSEIELKLIIKIQKGTSNIFTPIEKVNYMGDLLKTTFNK